MWAVGVGLGCIKLVKGGVGFSRAGGVKRGGKGAAKMGGASALRELVPVRLFAPVAVRAYGAGVLQIKKMSVSEFFSLKITPVAARSGTHLAPRPQKKAARQAAP